MQRSGELAELVTCRRLAWALAAAVAGRCCCEAAALLHGNRQSRARLGNPSSRHSSDCCVVCLAADHTLVSLLPSLHRSRKSAGSPRCPAASTTNDSSAPWGAPTRVGSSSAPARGFELREWSPMVDGGGAPPSTPDSSRWSARAAGVQGFLSTAVWPPRGRSLPHERLVAIVGGR